jgi:hypothetical protein
MSGAGNSKVTAAAELALAVYRSPARHADLLRGNASLPSGVTPLLRIAGGTAPEELDTGLAALAPVEELRKAALFFIEQVLFQRDASHYRLLGLNQSAAPEQVKEHHRLLTPTATATSSTNAGSSSPPAPISPTTRCAMRIRARATMKR